MKLQIDTDQKVIRIDERVNLLALFEFLQKTLPYDWKDFTLETNSINSWGSPIVIKDNTYIQQPYHVWPWYQQPGSAPPVSLPYTVSGKYDMNDSITNMTDTINCQVCNSVLSVKGDSNTLYVSDNTNLKNDQLSFKYEKFAKDQLAKGIYNVEIN